MSEPDESEHRPATRRRPRSRWSRSVTDRIILRLIQSCMSNDMNILLEPEPPLPEVDLNMPSGSGEGPSHAPQADHSPSVAGDLHNDSRSTLDSLFPAPSAAQEEGTEPAGAAVIDYTIDVTAEPEQDAGASTSNATGSNASPDELDSSDEEHTITFNGSSSITFIRKRYNRSTNRAASSDDNVIEFNYVLTVKHELN